VSDLAAIQALPELGPFKDLLSATFAVPLRTEFLLSWPETELVPGDLLPIPAPGGRNGGYRASQGAKRQEPGC
jgi:hypothetical protein